MAAASFAVATILGDLWHWIVGVVTRIADLSPYLLALALLLKTAESAWIGLVWRNILRAAYPKSKVSFKTAWGASQGGTAINAIVPAQGGTAVMIGLFRTSISGSSVAGLASAVVVQSLFYTAVSVVFVIGAVFLRPGTVSKGSPSNESAGFFASHPILIPIVIVALIVVLVYFWPRLKPKVLEQWRHVKQGAAIFKDWERYAKEVAAPSAASYVCRIGVSIVFMAAFSIPVTVFTVLLVAASHTLSGLFSITPGGVGQTQALDVATLAKYVPAGTGAVAAFSITQDSVLTMWNVVLGLVVLLWAFGWSQLKLLLTRKGRAQEIAEQPGTGG
jgi:uncharacterized membrane protein YbhN (UPF0104 family)